MSVSGDTSEQVVRMYLEGVEVLAKVSGKGAEHTIALLLNVMKDHKQTKGKARLNTMLKSGKPLSIFTISRKDLAKFSKEAKRYGVLYSALMNKLDKSEDGLVDIMVRADDASKINRIVERFKLTTSNDSQIKTEILKTRDEKSKAKTEISKDSNEKEIVATTNSKQPIDKADSNIKYVVSETGGFISYSGKAFINCHKKYPKIDLFVDNKHPTPEGTYLSACCMYAAIYGESPEGIEYYPRINVQYKKTNKTPSPLSLFSRRGAATYMP